MQTITISISDTTYQYIKERSVTCVECRAAAMLDLAVDAQRSFEESEDIDR